jgi:hypothetical protein
MSSKPTCGPPPGFITPTLGKVLLIREAAGKIIKVLEGRGWVRSWWQGRRWQGRGL